MSLGSKTKRCACGASSRFPICDGSHRSAGWHCNPPLNHHVEFAFLASPSLVNLAERLADRFKGVVLRDGHEQLSIDRLIILNDGQGLNALKAISQRSQAESRLVIGVGVFNDALAMDFEGAGFIAIPDDNAIVMWTGAEAAVSSSLPQPAHYQPLKVFLSHAVADEGALFGSIDVMRAELRTEFFVCADSVSQGQLWRDSIADHLERCDLFLFIVSKKSALSVYCAYEVGMATAMQKPIRMVSLDGTSPPAFVSHIQAISLPRLIERKPWLDVNTALFEALLESTKRPVVGP